MSWQKNHQRESASLATLHLGHAVQFYEDNEYLIELLAEFVKECEELDQSCLIICTSEHAQYLKNTLRLRYPELTYPRRPRRLQYYDASELLNSLLRDGKPDASLFFERIEPLIRSSLKERPGVRLFGEMVALLCAEGNYDSAIALEHLWNELRQTLPFTLLCAYPVSLFSEKQFADSLNQICSEHTIALPSESYSALDDESTKLQEIVQLQQKASSVDAMKDKLESQMLELQSLNHRIQEQLKEREDILLQERLAMIEAQNANRMKDEFLAMISHELRTPLTTLFGWTRLLRTGKVHGAVFERALEVIERSARTQMQMIEDLLDASRIFAGKLELDLSDVQIETLVRSAVQIMHPLAAEKEIAISIDIQQNLPPVRGDKRRLQQVLFHLLSNAIKFTNDRGSIRISSFTMQNCAIQLVVSDTGKGISSEFIPYLFRRFSQQDAGLNRKNGGLGLGLAIARQLVEAHNGRIFAESAGIGQGAKFIVELPVVHGEQI